MEFEISNYRKIQNNSSIVSEFDVRIIKWGLTLPKCKEISGKNGGTFIAEATTTYTNKLGEKKYQKHWLFDEEVKVRFQTGVKRALEEFLSTQSHVETQRTVDEEVPF